MSDLAILLPALTLCVLMILTHAYLGLHVLARGIIFVDLALAQVAALGVSLAFLLGKDAHGLSAQMFALGATLVAALGFARLRAIPDKVAREVAIGCVYVVTTALSIVILSRSAMGMEEMKSMFNGNILWVRWSEIGIMAVVYFLLTLLHLAFGKRFLALSTDKEGKRRSSFVLEFLFFGSFAVVITLAVNLAGVLLVFAFLIIPAFSASILTKAFSKRLVVGWIMGLAGSVAGLAFSYEMDLPTGATVVSCLGILPLVSVAIYFMKTKRATGQT